MPTKFRPITHIITGTAPVNPWPPTGSYTLCARLYTNTFLDHITLNTVSWNFDSRSSGTYSDPNCNNYLSNLSSWNDYSANTVLQTTGQNEYGTYVDIFTDVDNQGEENAVDFCVILGNDRVETIVDDSWKITRVEVFKVGMSNGIYRVNNNPSKGQWFRNRNDWTEFPITPSSSTIFRPITIFENIPDPPSQGYIYFLWYVTKSAYNYSLYQHQDFALYDTSAPSVKITSFNTIANSQYTFNNEMPAYGFDGDADTKWCSNNTWPNWCIFTKESQSIDVIGFSLMTANDHTATRNRAPVTYKLCGSNTQTTDPTDPSWVVLYQATDDITFYDANDNKIWVDKYF